MGMPSKGLLQGEWKALIQKLGQCANTLLHSNRVLAQLSVDM